MYFDAASSLPSRATCTSLASPDDNLARRLWHQVHAAFPDLSGSRFEIDQRGGDHLLLIVDETRAFRFPRPGRHGLGLEIALLKRLRNETRVAVPSYDIVDPDGDFASYRLITGMPLTPSRFALLPDPAAHMTITSVVTLLRSLHAIDPQTIAAIEAWPRMWSAVRYADRIEAGQLPSLASRLPELTSPISAFLQDYRADRAPCVAVLHGDLVDDHLLVDGRDGRLTGVIDFSDVALGDPACDLLGFWAYGTDAAAYAARTYDCCGADPTLFARSRNHFIRYRIERLHDMIVEGASVETIADHAAALKTLLGEDHRPSSLTATRIG